MNQRLGHRRDTALVRTSVLWRRLLLVGVFVGIIGAILAIYLVVDRRQIEKSEMERLRGLAHVAHEIIAREFSSVDTILVNARNALASVSPEFDQPIAAQYLRYLTESAPIMRTLQILNDSGNVVVSSREYLIRRDIPNRDYFQTPRRVLDPDKLYVSVPFETVFGVYSINLTRLILGADGTFKGVVTATIDPEFFTVLLRALVHAPGIQTGLASQDGIVFLNVPENRPNLGRNIAVPGSIFTKHRQSGQSESVWSARVVATQDDRVIVVKDMLSPAHLDKPINLAISRKLDVVFESWWEKTILLGSVYAVSSIALFFAVFLYQRIKGKSEHQIRLLSSIVEQSPISVVVTNQDGAIDYVNNAFTETTGYTPDEVLGKNPRLLQSGHTSQETYRDLWSTLQRGESWRGEFLNRVKSGATIWERVAIFPIKDNSGNSLQYVAIKENVTKGKEIQAELLGAKERAEASSTAKTTFLAMMSHELRTPLNAVIGFAEMMRKQTLGPLGRPQYVEYAEDIEKSGRHLLDVLNDMLDLTKLESGNFTPYLQSVSLVRIVKGLASVLSSIATDAGHAMTFRIDNDAMVVCDRRAVRQILINLASNSAKYTRRGGEIQVNVDPRPDGKVDLSVKDNGVGMAAEDIQRATELFTRLENRGIKSAEGVGIGLYMVRRLVEEMGASLKIDSEPEVGTTVTVTFAGVSAE